ncbi:unnamed protein product [Parnassius apollo]|uniref:(apollo) hypothetical protein n=1 Tax=Parnassius apollo TaxID=110799 RepID=A0A8S3XA89_PARAO|nr:unnamed protein product [Parnassius apollo]
MESKGSETKTKEDKNKAKVDRKRAKEEINKAEDKSKVGYRNKNATHVNVNVVKQHIPENNYVIILSQIRNAPENIASYDLGESNIFGKRGTMTELKSTYNDTNNTENRENNETDFTKNEMKNVLENKSGNKKLNIAQKEEIEKRKHAEEDETGENIQIEEREEDEIREIMQNQEREDESGENMQTEFIFNINDTIIVRYYLRKTWKHYIGFAESIEFKDGLNYYQVKFLKAIKESFNSLKFTFPRKLDIDIILTNNSIVKKVNLVQKEEASKEYYLEEDRDLIFFT